MDDAPFTGDMNLDAARTREELAALLRTVHVRSDRPSLRTLEARTRHSATPLSKTAVAEMLKGVRFPRKAVMIAFLRACGLQDEGMETWRRAWERVASSDGAPGQPEATQASPGQQKHAAVWQNPLPDLGDAETATRAEEADSNRPVGSTTVSAESAGMRRLREQINRLSSDNDRLRGQLAATQRGAAEEVSPENVASGQLARGPVVRRRELGALLRGLRAEKQMTVQEVAEHLMCSQSKVRRIETGFRSGTIRDVRDLCDLYGVTEAAERDHLMELARESKQQGWWQSYNVPYSTYVGLEADAASIKNYHSTLVPGLLQTIDYARALRWNFTGSSLSTEVIEQQVETRLIRQRRLTEADPPRSWFILDEAALHRVIGGRGVMTAQLDRLIELAGLPNVGIQVIPYEVGAYPAMDSPFAILDFAAVVDSVAYVEGLFGFLYIERPEDVKRYHLVFEALHAMALDEKESIERIVKARKDLR